MVERLKVLRNGFWRLVMPILIGLFLIVLAAFGIIYYQQEREQDSLAEQIGLKSNVISSFESREEEFMAELEQVEAEFKSTEDLFPDELIENEVYKGIMLLAQDAAVALDMKPGSEATETVEGTQYRVLNFTLSVDGVYYDVVNFINTLDSHQTLLGSLLVKGLNIRMTENRATATVDCKVYALS